MRIKGYKELVFRYGGKKFLDDTYKLIDVLAHKDTTYNSNAWELMQEQYSRFIINKVTFAAFNFNITWRQQTDWEGKLDWNDVNENYPFYSNKFHEWQDVAGKEGYYVKVIKSLEVADANIKLHDASNVNRSHIYPFGFPGRKKRGFKRIYYPRCTKSAATGIANMPFVKTIGETLNTMDPKGEEYFRFAFGYGPFNTESVPTDITKGFIAREVIVSFEVLMTVEMTFSSRKVVNQLQ